MSEPRKPKALLPGQTVGLIAASSAMPEPARLTRAIAALESMGYNVKVSEGCYARHGYLAGPDGLRAAELNRMFADDTVDGIVCARGGYGATRILGRIDYDILRANPKVFSGYSDVTALHGAIQRHAGFVTFHGLMGVSDLGDETPDAYSVEWFLRMLRDTAPAGPLEDPEGTPPRRAIVPGRAEGRLIGGNLSLVASCMGTPYAWDFDGAILFLEDVNERSYAVDRMLTQLKNAGVFDRVAGVLLGTFNGRDPKEDSRDFTTEEVFESTLGDLRVPVLSGIQCGHIPVKLTLPLGIRYRMDADAGTLRALEGAVV
ncbi:LD-carboxypeptidase [Eubacteriales bacterium OttesenSCG-928-A19]|nr:LD-carboxypeptidase [Eubacteriales bacterium OttesenSCG-928-A19]